MGLALILLIILTVLLWPQIARWLRGLILRQAERSFRRAMGMPPPQSRNRSASANSRRRHTYTYKKSADTSIIPKEYAEDVDFVEVKNFSETEIRVDSGKGKTEYHESQVSDAEWEEMK